MEQIEKYGAELYRLVIWWLLLWQKEIDNVVCGFLII